MKQIFFFGFFLSCCFLFACNSSFHSGFVYQKAALCNIGEYQVSCYRIGWGLNGESWVISTNKDVCPGFDTTKDIFFSSSINAVYFEKSDKNLKLFTQGTASVPKHFPIAVEFQKLTISDAKKMSDDFKNGRVNKIIFDSITYEVPCKFIFPY